MFGAFWCLLVALVVQPTGAKMAHVARPGLLYGPWSKLCSFYLSKFKRKNFVIYMK